MAMPLPRRRHVLALSALLLLPLVPGADACTTLPARAEAGTSPAAPLAAAEVRAPCPPPYARGVDASLFAAGELFLATQDLRFLNGLVPRSVPGVTPFASPAHAGPSDGLDVQDLLFAWPGPTPKIDVVVVPPAHGQLYNSDLAPFGGLGPNEALPFTSSYVQAMAQAVKDWEKAAKTYSPLLAGFTTTVGVVGPGFGTGALGEAEVIVLTVENMAHIGGIGGLGAEGGPCFVLMSEWFLFSFSFPDMYNVFAHEFAHCLGLDHATGGGPGFHDSMMADYDHVIGSPWTHLRCPSNLNVKGLEQSLGFAGFAGFAQQDPEKYATIAC